MDQRAWQGKGNARALEQHRAPFFQIGFYALRVLLGSSRALVSGNGSGKEPLSVAAACVVFFFLFVLVSIDRLCPPFWSRCKCMANESMSRGSCK